MASWRKKHGPQWFRRSIQISVFLFLGYASLGGIWRNYKVAHNSRRIVGLLHGDGWAKLYGANEDFLSRFGDSYEVSLRFLGMPWSSTVLGLEGTDPILGLTHIVRDQSFPPALMLGMLVPILLALIFGKLFCSHLCPMRLLFEVGQWMRNALVYLGVSLPMFRSNARFGGWLLVGGLIAGALFGSAIWFFLLPYASLAVAIFLGIAYGVYSSLWLVVLALWMFDMTIAPGYFCKNLCPTGFLLGLLGRRSLLRIDKNRPDEPCPANCRACELSCPYRLTPQRQTQRPLCDNCAVCVSVCPSDRLARKIGWGSALLFLALFHSPGEANAHHNKGLPHYGYFENYPQVPTEEYIRILGDWEIGATVFNFQGLDRSTADTPNDVKIYLYVYDLESDANYLGPIQFKIVIDGEVVSETTRDAADEETVYVTRETLPKSGVYSLEATLLGANGQPKLALPFSVDLASDRVNWLLIGAMAMPVFLIFALALFGRTKRREAMRKNRAAETLGLLLLAGWLGLSNPAQSLAFDESAVAERGVECAVCGMIDCPMEHKGARTASNGEEEGVVCPHCGMVDCTMVHLTNDEGREVMIMGGIPRSLFLVGIGLIILLSFVFVEWFAPKAREGFRWNLIGNKRIYRWVQNRWFQVIPQLAMVAVFAFLVYAGLFGSRVANIAPVAVWTIWWGGLIFAVALTGPMFCFACPWDGIANLASRLRVAARVQPLTLGLKVPGALKLIYPSILLFGVLTWLELGYGVTSDPRWTIYMGLGMAAMAVGFALLYDGKVFCASLCPVGRISGIYANFSPVEIRSKNPRVCASCRTEECLTGNEKGYACPTGISLKTMAEATHCIFCTECVKSCDKNNVAFNLRPFGSDLKKIANPRMDEAWMALILLALTLFHGISMTPVWENFQPGGDSFLKWMQVRLGTPKSVNFTIGMLGFTLIPVALYWVSCKIGAAWAKEEGIDARTLFVRYAYSLLPIALFYHLAHNSMHLLGEGGHIVPMLSDPLGDGSNYFGTAGMKIGHLVSEEFIWYLEVALILIGHLFGVLVAHRIGHGLFKERANATKSLAPMLVMMILISVCGLWLMHLDMNMRVGRM